MSNNNAPQKPEPNIDLDIAPFWAGVEKEQFLLLQCTECEAWYWPVAYCLNCPPKPFAANMVWTEASGLGSVFTYNIHHMAFEPSFEDDIPYVYAMIELDEGPMFGTNIVNCDVNDVDVGDRVRIVFERNDRGGFTLPKAERIVGG